METISRPWQGTILGVLFYIGVALSVILGIFMIFGLNFISSVFTGATQGTIEGVISSGQLDVGAAVGAGAVAGGIQGFFAALGTIAGFIFLVIGLINYLIGKAVMNGKKWSLIVIIILSALNFLASLSGPAYASLVISAVFIALSASVITNPFYQSAPSPSAA